MYMHNRQPENENGAATARRQVVYSTELYWLGKYRRAAAAPLIAALATFSGCPNHLRSLKQNMAYRRHTHSLHCCNPNISGCL